MKSFKNYITEGIITGRGGAADKKTILQEKYTREIREWCNKYAKDSEINKLKVIIKGGKVICSGDLYVDRNVKQFNFPFEIDILDGDLDFSWCTKLESLEECPKIVKGNFTCECCTQLESLKGSPETVDGDFNCCSCENLTSIKGAPKTIGGDFYCINCSAFSNKDIERVCKVSGVIHR